MGGGILRISAMNIASLGLPYLVSLTPTRCISIPLLSPEDKTKIFSRLTELSEIIYNMVHAVKEFPQMYNKGKEEVKIHIQRSILAEEKVIHIFYYLKELDDRLIWITYFSSLNII